MNVIAKIDETVNKYNMLSRGDSVVIGVSGGKDSMLLLSYFLEKREELNLNLTVANVEHGIRGEASKRDTQFVKDFCRDNGVTFKGLEIDAPAEAKKLKMGVEEYSRKRRYEFFESLEADKIATAHSLSDNVETLLFRLARGTSLKGAKGIPPVRGKIIRPLIECTAQEIIEACVELEIPYVTDETNSDNAYSRNMIRNEIVPLLKKINPQAEQAMSRFITSASEDDSCITQFALELVSNDLSIETLKKTQPSVAKRAIEIYANSFGVTLDETHLNEVYSLINKSGKTQIKDSLFAVSNKDRLYFTDLTENTVEFKINAKAIPADEFNKSEYSDLFYCDSNKICGEVFVRQRAEGDSISPQGRNCTKSLKKLFNELKIPIEKRYKTPVICDEKGVIGIYNYAVSQRVAVDSETENVYLLNVKTEDKV